MKIGDCMETLRKQIYIIKDQRNCSMWDFSILCNISYDCLCRILYNKSKDINLSTLLKISQGTGRSISSLINEKEAQMQNDSDFLRVIYAEMEDYLKKGIPHIKHEK